MTLHRLAIVSDIHGNLPALEAVWEAIGRAGVDRVVDLGDIASGPLWPRETVRWLMTREAAEPGRWTTIRGNHERQVLAPDIAAMGASDAFAARELGADERAWLGALPATLQLEADVLLCHGTPTSDLVYFLETVVPGRGVEGGRGIRAATMAEARARAEGAPADSLVLCGHSHVARVLSIDGGPLVVNPGSVGLQAYDDEHPLPHVVEAGSPHARWAVVERRAAGGWDVELRATAYDWRSAAARAASNGRGDWADALATGFVGRTEAEALDEGRRRDQPAR